MNEMMARFLLLLIKIPCKMKKIKNNPFLFKKACYNDIDFDYNS